MKLVSILSREFGMRAMRERADRYYVIEDVKDDLEKWRQYGEVRYLEQAISRLEAQR